MSGVQTVEVSADDDGLRLDRWFRRHFPGLSHGRLERLLRKGEVRLDGRRTRSGVRIAVGQQIRVPPMADAEQPRKTGSAPVRPEDTAWLSDAILHMDDRLIAINKPAGLAVQGGTGTHRHLDAMLDALRFKAAERPRLVHRLDKDTSGVLLLGRTAAAAAGLTRAFRERATRKLYWALVAGVPQPQTGQIKLRLAKRPGAAGERVRAHPTEGKAAITDYGVIDKAGRSAAWLGLRPVTGRTHQLRAHCAAIGTPILGDGKYGRREQFAGGLGAVRRLQLHARSIELPTGGNKTLRIEAPVPKHMADCMRDLGFDPTVADDPFAEDDA